MTSYCFFLLKKCSNTQVLHVVKFISLSGGLCPNILTAGHILKETVAQLFGIRHILNGTVDSYTKKREIYLERGRKAATVKMKYVLHFNNKV